VSDPGEDVLVDWSTVSVLVKRETYMVNGTPFTIDPLDPHQTVPMPRWFVEKHGLKIIEDDKEPEYDI
jgi:hypothetical protein